MSSGSLTNVAPKFLSLGVDPLVVSSRSVMTYKAPCLHWISLSIRNESEIVFAIRCADVPCLMRKSQFFVYGRCYFRCVSCVCAICVKFVRNERVLSFFSHGQFAVSQRVLSDLHRFASIFIDFHRTLDTKWLSLRPVSSGAGRSLSHKQVIRQSSRHGEKAVAPVGNRSSRAIEF
jgi:hypothetical protein